VSLATGAAHFVAALDASIARGDLETPSQDLEHLLGRPPTLLTDVVRAAYDVVAVEPGTAVN
jgi:NAD(P)H dehydrogenase (quinone)